MTFRDPVKKPQPQKPGTPAPIPVRVAGTVSANIPNGALESGGNLAAATASLADIAGEMDDIAALVALQRQANDTLALILLQLDRIAERWGAPPSAIH